MKEILVALAGNPNCGKSTLFNELTGGRQHVSNYPGITVEKKEGILDHDGVRLKIVDLPGTYSLSAYSIEELIARDFLVEEKPQVVINIVDSTNLERHLYLTIQLLELGVPVVIALNMMDLAEQKGITIDAEKLGKRLGVFAVPIVARSGKGKKELISKVIERAENPNSLPLNISYGPDIDYHIHEMEEIIKENRFLTDKYPARWVALKYLEEDEEVIKRGEAFNKDISTRLRKISAKVAEHLEKTLQTYPEAIIADYRYGFINAILKDDVVKVSKVHPSREVTDYIDKVVTNRFLGPIIMVLVIYSLYKITFNYSEVPTEWLTSFFEFLGKTLSARMEEGLLRSLLVDAIIGGVGSVVGFLPLIAIMFFLIAILEDTGYLARVAYMCDRVFRTFGLHGNSVMALIIGGGIAGGCAVPGIMATRTLRSSKERIATILVTPFMNCGAKMPVYAMIIATFFQEKRSEMMLLLTLLSWFFALLTAKLVRSTILKGSPTPFLLELPVYRLPTLKGLLIHTWERMWQYLKKAGTIILAVSIIVWALMTFPKPSEESLKGLESRERAKVELEYSIAGRIGKSLTVVSEICGFDWRMNVALIGGFTAKEVILSTLGTVYAIEAEDEETLSETIRKDPFWDKLKAIAFMIFVMVYAPCVASLACIRKETGTIRWSIFSVILNTSIAFLLATTIYNLGRWLGY